MPKSFEQNVRDAFGQFRQQMEGLLKDDAVKKNLLAFADLAAMQAAHGWVEDAEKTKDLAVAFIKSHVAADIIIAARATQELASDIQDILIGGLGKVLGAALGN